MFQEWVHVQYFPFIQRIRGIISGFVRIQGPNLTEAYVQKAIVWH